MVGSSTSSYTFIYSTGLFTRNIVTVKIGLNFFVQCLLSYKDINPHLDTSAKRFGYIIVRFKDGSSCQLEDFQTFAQIILFGVFNRGWEKEAKDLSLYIL